MNKKLLAVAVASAIGAVAAPSVALAQASSVTLSGSLNFNYGYFNTGSTGFAAGTSGAAGVPKASLDGLSNQESELVASGEENLGGGLSAYFRCATSMDITGGGAGGSTICGRTSYIGLKSSSYGSISFGNNDTPTKRYVALYDPFPISAAMGQGAQMWNATASNTANAATPASFSRRQQNLITYDMPTWNGFDAAIAFTSTNEATAAGALTVQKPRMWAAAVNYTNGPLMLGGGYEAHKNYNPGALATYGGGTDDMWTLNAGYTFAQVFKLGVIWNRINYSNVTVGTDMSVRTWGLYGNWAIMGPHTLRLGYGNQGSTSGSYNGLGAAANAQVGVWTGNGGAGGTGAQKYVVEYAYALSKRTEVGLDYAMIKNDRFSNITIGTGSNTPNYGETQTFAGMMIRHKF
jgi:predicted porin